MRRFLLLLIVPILAFIYPILTSPPTVDATASNCVLTKVGNPPANEVLPAGCAVAAGDLPAGPMAQKAIALAKAQIGKHYILGTPNRNWKANSPDKAPSTFDCSGLTGWSWYWASGGKINFGGQTAQDWNNPPANLKKFDRSQLSQIQPGDLIYWAPGDIHHTAIYEGPGGCGKNDCFIEAPNHLALVREQSLSHRDGSGSERIVGFLRPMVQ